MKFIITASVAMVTIAISTTAQAFCGFYVARADTSLFNSASQVVLVRDDDRTVITMANDFQGEVKDFAVYWQIFVLRHNKLSNFQITESLSGTNRPYAVVVGLVIAVNAVAN